MHNSFINEYSYKCLLGPQSKNVSVLENVAMWTVGKKKHFTNLGLFDGSDILYLKEWGESNFHYITEENLELLKINFKVKRTKYESTCINLEDLKYNGKKNSDIRNSINRNAKLNLVVQDHFNDIKDVEEMIEEWSKLDTKKYFRDFSGKNTFFFKNSFHLNCHNIFIYHESRLVAFAVLSPTEYSSYIIGKSLFKRLPGLTEYLDDLAYKKAIISGIKVVNLGQSKGAIAKYKNKFPGSFIINHFDGNIE